MTTLKLVSEYCKLALPFLAASYCLLVASLDHHRGWKLLGSISSMMVSLVIGVLAVYFWVYPQ